MSLNSNDSLAYKHQEYIENKAMRDLKERYPGLPVNRIRQIVREVISEEEIREEKELIKTVAMGDPE